jgi:hypothetical protein
MTKDLKDRKFKIEIFIISFVVISILTAVSFLAAWARDEGQIDDNNGLVANLLADSFYFFRLPTHGLFWDTIVKNSSKLFLPTLSINVIFWAFLTERLVVVLTRLIRKRRLKSNIR